MCGPDKLTVSGMSVIKVSEAVEFVVKSSDSGTRMPRFRSWLYHQLPETWHSQGGCLGSSFLICKWRTIIDLSNLIGLSG